MKSERRDRKPYAAWCDRCHIRIANGEYNPKHRIGKKKFHEDEKFWANLDATRRAMERATAGIDMSTLAFAAEDAAKLASTMDFEKISSTLALGDYALRQYERFSTNSALVGETPSSTSWSRRSESQRAESLAHGFTPPNYGPSGRPAPIVLPKAGRFRDQREPATRASGSQPCGLRGC